jgi:hypothetical protein
MSAIPSPTKVSAQNAVLTVGGELRAFCSVDDQQGVAGLQEQARELAAEFAAFSHLEEWKVQLRCVPRAALVTLKSERAATLAAAAQVRRERWEFVRTTRAPEFVRAWAA